MIASGTTEAGGDQLALFPLSRKPVMLVDGERDSSQPREPRRPWSLPFSALCVAAWTLGATLALLLVRAFDVPLLLS